MEEVNDKSFDKDDYSRFVLGVDVGATKTNVGMFGIRQNRPVKIFSKIFHSRENPGAINPINETLRYAKEHYDINCNTAGIGAAGVVNDGFVKLTQLDWSLSVQEIRNHTMLQHIFVFNDAQAFAYSLDVLEEKDLLTIGKPVIPDRDSSKVLITVGTGMGVSLVFEDKVYPSEGGHVFMGAQSRQEQDLVEFVKAKKSVNNTKAQYFVSGLGLENIFEWLVSIGKKTDVSPVAPDLMKNYENDAVCKECVDMFLSFLARECANLALTTLCYGGVFLGGGVIVKNPGLFKDSFFRDLFENHPGRHGRSVLERVPLFMIANPDAAILGAARAASEK